MEDNLDLSLNTKNGQGSHFDFLIKYGYIVCIIAVLLLIALR